MKKVVLNSILQESPVTLICPDCGSGLVYPLQRRRVSARRWFLLLTCPECFCRQIVSVTGREIDSINEYLEFALAEIAASLAAAEWRHMRDECDKFIGALRAGNIQPIDF